MKLTIHVYCLLIICLLLPKVIFAQKWVSPVPVIPNTQITNLTNVRYAENFRALVIEYNPDLAIKVGPFVTAYFQAHEYAHIYLRHITKKKLKQASVSNTHQFTTSQEIEAEKYAFQYLYLQDRSVILAMIHYLHITDKEDLPNFSHIERAKLLQTLMGNLDAVANAQTLPCLHKAHNFDEYSCNHLLASGKTLHMYDPGTCTHVKHPEGDEVGRRLNKTSL